MVLGGRYRTGDVKPRMVSVASATVIEKGDLLYLDTTAKPAADVTWDTNIATTQEEFHDAFLGVAMAASADGETDPIPVATQGEFEFDCAAAQFAAGALVGTAKQSGNALESQKVVSVATANLAVGRVTKQYTANTTVVCLEIDSVVYTGGPRAAA
jgi:hypothetical protein